MARNLARVWGLPLLHIDGVQFQPGMRLRPLAETRSEINKVSQTNLWIIDGYGPLDILEDRLGRADRIVFVDLPLGIHYFWAILRVFKNLWSRRAELAPGCSELSFAHILKLFRTIHRIHHKMRPEMLRLLSKPEHQAKVFYVRSVGELNRASCGELGSA